MLLAIGSLTALGVVLGAALGLVVRPAAARTPPRPPAVSEREILALLPGLQCGQCGWVRCERAAAALAAGRAGPAVCRVGREPVARALSARLGVPLARGLYDFSGLYDPWPGHDDPYALTIGADAGGAGDWGPDGGMGWDEDEGARTDGCDGCRRAGAPYGRAVSASARRHGRPLVRDWHR